MKYKDLKSKSPEERASQLAELEKELIKLMAQVATGAALQSPGKVKQTKKMIARLKQLQND